jgi:hypothetical protein
VKLKEQLKSGAALPVVAGGSADESQISEQASPRFVNELVIERVLGVPVKTLRNWRVSGRGPPFSKLGASVRYELATALLRLDPRFRQLTDRLWRLGPRPTGELILEIAAAHGFEAEVLDRLERFARIDPALVAGVDARDWPPLPSSEVA